MSLAIDRREFLCSLAGCAAVAAVGGCSDITHSDFFRKRFREIEEGEMVDIIADLEARQKEKYGKDVTISTKGAQPGVEFGYALDVSRCVGCRKCEYACADENNQNRDPELHWIRVLEMEQKTGIDFHKADAYYEPETVPEEGMFYLPVACQQCRNAPCVKSCPVGATWQEDDGIVVVDQDWCIGCRCCVAACPYGARHFNWTEPEIPADDLNTQQHYLGNRPRPKGVVEKCTFCIHKVRDGEYPACMEACPVGARTFGNLLDADGDLRYILENKKVFVLKGELNTRPRFYYYYG